MFMKTNGLQTEEKKHLEKEVVFFLILQRLDVLLGSLM